ncbi:MAG: ATP-binding protein [Acidobacteriota bacterium]|nr:ATP-binding protein [Acidobacteriota bacterium]
MASRFRSLLGSFGIRLLVPLFLTVAVVLALHTFLNFRSAQDQLTSLISSGVKRNSGLVRRATHDGMLLNQLDEVQALLERMAEGPEILAIRVYDKEGRIVLSASPDEIGLAAQLEDTPCLSCHGPGAPASAAAAEASAAMRTASGVRAVRYLSVIENETVCATAGCHAHPPERAVLGVLDLEMSLAPVEAAERSVRRQLLVTTALLLLVTATVVWVLVRRLVQQPVSRLREGARRVAAGELGTRIDVGGEHELARLAHAFNSMTEDLAQARGELEGWSRRLEETVAEKTSELQRTQRQVLHMEKMASLGKLAATVAHELNNPLSGILTYARLVERELDRQPLAATVAEELRHHLRVIESECSRCGGVVRNLLLFARHGAGEKAQVDLDGVLERSLALVRHHLEMHGVRLRTERELADATIWGDAGQLEQALVALCVNAVEAMVEAGDGEGELTVRMLEGEADEIVVEVADTGVGIPAEIQTRIFEPFFTTKSEPSGVGLGLAVVYGIVRGHGGQIEVESSPGRGATFRLRLPRGGPEAAADAPPDQEARE